MCVRIAVDMDIFTTLSERNGPVSLEELAAVKKASPILAGNPSNPFLFLPVWAIVTDELIPI